MAATNARAQKIFNYLNNPFGLVYENAITENVPGEVNIHPVTYPATSPNMSMRP